MPNEKNIYTNADLIVSVTRVDERVKTMSDDIRELKTAIVGAEKAGLIERTALLEHIVSDNASKIKCLQKIENKSSINYKHLIGIAFGAIGSLIAIIKLLVEKIV